MRRKTPTRTPVHSRENSGHAMVSFSSPVATPSPATPASGTNHRAFQYELSALHQAFFGFCMLTGMIALFISHMMASSSSATFTIPFVEHGWSRDEKSGACQRAGIGYFLLAVLVLLNPLLRHRRISHCRFMLWSRCRRNIPKDRLAMLGYTRKGSDQSEDEEEEEME